MLAESFSFEKLMQVRAERAGIEEGETRPSQRILLYAGEVMRLPSVYQRVRVAAGVAYMTQGGRDMIVATGESLELHQSHERTFHGPLIISSNINDNVLVSPLRNDPLVLELFE